MRPGTLILSRLLEKDLLNYLTYRPRIIGVKHLGKLETPPFLKLVGDSTENFYQLGLKDRNRHKNLLNHALGVISTPWKPLNQGVQETLKTLIIPALEKHPEYKKKISAYAEGLGESPQTLAMAYAIPELMCFMNKWMPGIPIGLMGCSSTFTWDSKRDALVHGRILDFPFHGSFDRQERAVLSHLDRGPKMLSFHSAGFGFPCITTMTDNGVSFALHQKFGSTFNPKGTPIFEIVYQMLQNCSNKNEVIRFLKKQQSITTWGFYMGFKNGDILSLELDGAQLHYHEYQATPDKILYFCNERERAKLNSPNVIPYSFYSQNKMRKLCFQNKMKEFKMNHLKEYTTEHIIRLMGRAHEQVKVAPKDWLADPLTPSSLQTVAMLPGIDEAYTLPGLAPKFFNQEVIQYKDSFQRAQQKVISFKGKSNSPTYQKGLYHMMQAQVALDLKDKHNPYHHIQLAIEYLEGFPIQKVALFYFYVLQYMNETHKKSLSQIYHLFKGLEGQLSPYLEDQRKLFIFRINKVLERDIEIRRNDIESDALKNIYHFENKLPQIILHKMTRSLMVPRIDLYDILYPYVK